MKNLIKKIMQSKYRFVFIWVLIVLFVSLVGATTIILLSDVVTHDNIYYENVLVQDKYVDNNTGRYVIVNDKFQDFEALNDRQGSELYDQIQIGQRYNIVAHESFDHTFIHIARAYNATN